MPCDAVRSTVWNMDLSLCRAARGERSRGFTLIEVVVVVALVGMLAAVAWSTMVRPARTAQQALVETTLRTIAMEARQQARQSDGGRPADYLEAVVAQQPVPEQERALPDDDPSRFRLVADPDQGTVTMVRFGRCSVLTVPASTAAEETVTECDATNPTVGSAP